MQMSCRQERETEKEVADLRITKNLWVDLKHAASAREAINISESEVISKKEWEKIPKSETCQTFSLITFQ